MTLTHPGSSVSACSVVRRSVAGAAVALTLAGLAACGTSTGPDGTSQAPATLTTGSPSAAPSDTPTPTASPSASAAATAAPTTAAVPTAAPQPGNLPEVTNATDLKKAPSIKAGTKVPTAVVTKDLVTGTGATAAASSQVAVQYFGANFADGKEFNSTWKDNGGQPTTFALTQVIPGFGQGILGMKVGGRREIVIPSEYGYGAQGSSPAVAPNENLVFIVDLVAVQ